MGAVNFSLDPDFVKVLQSSLPLRVLVETGTFHGDTILTLESLFDDVISIELSESLWSEAVNRFRELSHIRILQGNSGDKLHELRDELKSSAVLYWLDAHWCNSKGTAGDLSQCPLLSELAAIGSLNENSVVLIDDARLFLAPPPYPHEISQWPSFQQILQALQALSSQHELMVINDVIAYYPYVAKKVVTSFAQSHGIDWLDAAEFFNNQISLIGKLKEKESEINSQKASLDKLHFMLKEKEAVIKDQSIAIRAFTAAYGSLYCLQPFARFMRRFIEILLPRLGNLNQYGPRPISTQRPVKPNSIEQLLKFSIVTPSYQQGDFISRTINSVAGQEYSNLEFFVQDGGSQDSTVEILKRHEHIVSEWESIADNGQSHAINLGFQKTSGDIMGWLNSDDLLLPGALQVVSSFFQRHPNVDVVYGDRLLIDENEMEIGRWIMPGHDDAVLSWVDYVPQETMFWRRSLWDRVGGQIDETFRFAMDWDLLLRFRDAGAKFAHIPRFLGAFRVHGQQKTSSLMNQVGQEEMDRIRLRLHGYVPTKKEVRKAIRPFLLRHIFVDLKYRLLVRMRGCR